MTKKNNTTNVAIKSAKQQVSKILMKQAESTMKSLVKIQDSERRMKELAIYRFMTAEPGEDGWMAQYSIYNTYIFRFEIGRKTKAIRVSYMNSDGLQSAVYSHDEWKCMTSYIKDRLDLVIADRISEIKEIEEKTKKACFQREVEKAVEIALEKRQLRNN